jgi:hypothetical protein
MRRNIVIALGVLGGLVLLLAVGLASVGTNLDQTLLERDDLRFEVDDLQQSVHALSVERDQLRRQLDEARLEVQKLQAGWAAPVAAPAEPGREPDGDPAY